MELNNSEAYDLAIKIINDGKCSDSSLEEKHIQRGYDLKKVSAELFHITIGNAVIRTSAISVPQTLRKRMRLNFVSTDMGQDHTLSSILSNRLL